MQFMPFVNHLIVDMTKQDDLIESHQILGQPERFTDEEMNKLQIY